jgi:hypothetical protein
MPTKSKSSIITEGARNAALVQRRLPTHRPLTHPGEMLLEEFLKPLKITQSAFAVRLGVSFPRLNEVINCSAAHRRPAGRDRRHYRWNRILATAATWRSCP